MAIKIRDYQEGYSSKVNELAVAAFSEFKDQYEDWPSFAAKIGGMSSLASRSEIIVAMKDNKVVGAVAYVSPNELKADMFESDWAVVRMLVVDPSKRGFGIGRALTQECMKRAGRDGARCVGLHTSPIMQVALPMYLRMGFTKLKDVEDIHGVPYGVYVKHLNTKSVA